MKSIGIIDGSSALEIYLYRVISRSCRWSWNITYREFIRSSRWKILNSSRESILQVCSGSYNIVQFLSYSVQNKISGCRWLSNRRYSRKRKSDSICLENICYLKSARKSRTITQVSILEAVNFPVSTARDEECISREIQTRRFSYTVRPPEKLDYSSKTRIIR